MEYESDHSTPIEDHFIPEPITPGGMSACFVSTGCGKDEVKGLPTAVDKVSGVDGRQAVEYYYRYAMVSQAGIAS